MKRTRKRTTKLRVSRETLQVLHHTALRHAAGGFSDLVGGTSCDPACNIDSVDPQLC